MAKTIYVLNGPNLNLLGTREPETYGHATLADVEKLCKATAAQFGLAADCRQSNREGELIDFVLSSTPAAIRIPRLRCTTRWRR
jgi:3-dehydroquinate dehydratase-2